MLPNALNGTNRDGRHVVDDSDAGTPGGNRGAVHGMRPMSGMPVVSHHAVAPASAYGRAELLICAQGGLFGLDNARLPAPPMLMLDRITRIARDGGAHGKGELLAELDIRPDLWFFGCHFPGDPVMPGCLGLDALWQLTGFFLAWSGYGGRGRALGVSEVRFRGQVLPSARRVSYRLDIKRIFAGRMAMGIADGSLAVDGREIYSAKELRVGLFQPGEMTA